MTVWIATLSGGETAILSGTRSETETVSWFLSGVQDAVWVRVCRCVCVYIQTLGPDPGLNLELGQLRGGVFGRVCGALYLVIA